LTYDSIWVNATWIDPQITARRPAVVVGTVSSTGTMIMNTIVAGALPGTGAAIPGAVARHPEPAI